MKIIPVINYACIRTSAEDDNFPREGGGYVCVHNDFYLIWEFLCFGLSEKALSHVILGLLILDQSFSVFGLRERECMSNSVYECVCFMTLSY